MQQLRQWSAGPGRVGAVEGGLAGGQPAVVGGGGGGELWKGGNCVLDLAGLYAVALFAPLSLSHSPGSASEGYIDRWKWRLANTRF